VKNLGLIVGLLSILVLASCGEEESERQAGDVIWRKGAPTIVPSHGPVPKKLIVKDLRAGKGAVLVDGKTGSFRFKSFDYRTGQGYEDWWDRPFVTGFGKGESLDAWETGLKGMRVGGRRELIVPIKEAYGGVPVVYVIELVDLS